MGLVEGVGVVEILGLEVSAEGAVEDGDDVVEGAGGAGAGVVDARFAGSGDGSDGELDDVFDVDEVAALFAEFEYAGILAGFDLLGELVDHASGGAFVSFAWAVDVEVAQAYDVAGGVGAEEEACEVFELDFGEGVDVGRV